MSSSPSLPLPASSSLPSFHSSPFTLHPSPPAPFTLHSSLFTLLNHFDLIAEIPGAIPKLRQLILDLAVRGKLVPQDPNDEPPSELFKKIEAEKRRLVQSGEIKAPKPVAPITEEEMPYQVPKGWEWVRLRDISHDWGQKTPDSLFSYIDVGSIDNKRGLISPEVQILDASDAPSRARKIVKHGTVIYSTVRPYLLNIAIIDKNFEFEAIASTAFAILHPYQQISNRYLYFYLRSAAFVSYVEDCMKGVAYPAINDADFFRGPIPLPPLAEQKRIVAKVDELMAICDQLEAQQAERAERHAVLNRAALARFRDEPSPENLRLLFHPDFPLSPSDLRKTILDLAVKGKLVEQDPNDESADRLLATLANDVAKAVRAKQMRNTRPTSEYKDEYPFELPVGWAWSPLGNLTAAEDGAMCDGPFGSKLKTEHYIPTKGYAVLRLGNIGVGYFISGKEGHISREHFESLQSNHTAPGDLLVAGLADPLVRCCEIPPDIGPAVNKSDCFRVRLSQHMDRTYVRHYLNSSIAKAFAAEENHGMTRERINLANAKAIPVPVPPLAEQKRIVARVNELMTLVDELEGQINLHNKNSDNLIVNLFNRNSQ